MLEVLIIIIHVFVCLALILIILLQTGKGAGMGAAFGGSSQTVFGSTGRATFLTKVTIVAAVVFGLTSMGLSFLRSGGESVMDDFSAEERPSTMPEVPTVPELPAGVNTNVPGLPPAGSPGDQSAPATGLPDLTPPTGGEAPVPEPPPVNPIPPPAGSQDSSGGGQ